MFENILGSVTLILAVAMVVIALPKQIIKNHKDNRTGITPSLAWLPLGVYLSRAVYATLIGSWYIFIPDLLGVIFSAVLLFQVLVRPRLRTLEKLGFK